MLESLRFLKPGQVRQVAKQFGTPTFVYSQKVLEQQAHKALGWPVPFGLSVRYAMKANPNRSILQLFNRLGLDIDASSGFEAQRAVLAGVPPEHILLTTQELPANLALLIKQGVQFNATSLNQLASYGRIAKGSNVSLRVNFGIGSGGSRHTNVGGPAASFGIWHEYLDQARSLLGRYKLNLVRLHSHIGSGTDPKVWYDAALLSLGTIKHLPSVEIINLGGGFKVERMVGERSANLTDIGKSIANLLADFARSSGRQLKLEIEPGTFLVANAGSLVTKVHDLVDTGPKGYQFLKVDTGMTEILRPALYGAQHPIVVMGKTHKPGDYVVVGHCCESGDLLTPAPGEPGLLATRHLAAAKIGDLAVIEGTGAYCAAMSATGYNSFPAAAEVMLTAGGKFKLIRQRQTLEDMLAAES